MSQQLSDKIDEANCNFTGIAIGDYSNVSPDCDKYSNQMMSAFTGINIYDIYGKCWYFKPDTENFTESDVREKLFGKVVVDGVEHEYNKFFSAADYTPWLKKFIGEDTDYGIPGCIYALPAAEHLNTPEVRAQLNIKNSQVWRMCSVDGKSTFDYTMDAKASQWAYEALFQTPIRMMHYTGDKDGSVPTIGTERWINAMNRPVFKPWQEFTLADNQTAGYFQEFMDDFTLITVHGAGHMVPQDQRERAYHILFNWLFERGEFKNEIKENKREEMQFIQN